MLRLQIVITLCFLLTNITSVFSMKRVPECLNIKKMAEEAVIDELAREMRRKVLLAKLKAEQERIKDDYDEEDNTINDTD